MEPEGEFQVGMERILEQVKVKWKHLSPEEATWELESNMQEAYPDLFQEDVMEEWK